MPETSNYINSIISIILFHSVITIIPIKTVLFHYFYHVYISLIYFNLYYVNYFILKLSYQLYSLKPIISVLNHLFLFQYIICIISFEIYWSIFFHDSKLYQLFRLFHSNCSNCYNKHNWCISTTTQHSMMQCAFNPIGFN